MLDCNYVRLVYKSFKWDFYLFKICYYLTTYYWVTGVGHVKGIILYIQNLQMALDMLIQ
jgi:hypothetical protein